MPRYEVKFIVDFANELTQGEITNVAHDVYARMDQRGWLPKPEGRKVYVNRLYEPHEEQAIIKRHAANDAAAGRDWNKQGGCSCDLCKQYRLMGALFGGAK